MKAGITKFFILAAIAALVVVGSNTAAWAQCPASPNYTTDFSSALPPNPNCLSLTGNTGPGLTTSNPPVSGFPGVYPPAPQVPGSVNNPTAPPAGVLQVLRLTTNATGTSGSAWYTTQQPVAGTFSTTFMFQLSGTTTSPGDGFAFVIQNSSATALDPGNANGVLDGCSLGFGQSPDCDTTDPVTGIPNSLAVMFDTYQNVGSGDPSNSYVAIQSCGTANNTVDPGPCRFGVKDLTQLVSPITQLPFPINLADGNFHTVTISFTPSGACSAATPPGCPGVLDVILDSIDLFPAGLTPAGVAFDMASIGLTIDGKAWVGFTAATGGSDDNQDILSWTFTPKAQSVAVVAGGAPAFANFQGGPQNQGYDYNAQLKAGGGVTQAAVQILPILISEEACERLVQKSFPYTTQCFVYKNAAGLGVDSAIMFEVTCPGSSQGGECGNADTLFPAELGTDFTYTKAENPGFRFPGIFGIVNPFPGFLRGQGPDVLHPCTPYPNNYPPLFTSNQVDFFSSSGDPGGTTKGKTIGPSCWLATYFTWGELPPGIRITSPAFTTYTQNQSVTASYACNNPITSQPAGNATGPYLTAASCTQTQAPNPKNLGQIGCTSSASGLSCTGGVDTSATGLHAFQVNALDSGGNANIQIVIYNVVKKK